MTTHPHHLIACAAALAGLLAVACSDETVTVPTSRAAPPAASTDRQQPTYVIDTVDVSGALATSPQGINAAGDIVGIYIDATKHSHGFLLHDGTFTPIDYTDSETGAVANNSDARGIGPGGDIVGAFWNDGEEPVAAHGYHRSPDGTFARVHFPGHLYEFPQRILADGTILGCRHDHDLMASMRGIMIGRADTSDMANLYASMTNGATPDGNLVVGFYLNMMVTPSRTEAFVIAGSDTTSYLVPGSTFTTAWDIDARGDIVGVYRDAANVVHGYVRTGTGRTLADAEYTTVDVPGASATRVFGINARGDVVGAFVSGTGKSAVTHGFHATRVR